MSPTATLCDVKKSLSALIAATKATSKGSDVSKSMAQLGSALTLLELSSPPSTTVGKLAEMLRQPMLPLYREHPLPAYTFCSTVLDFVFSKRLSAVDRGSNEPTNSWEAVQRALLSGLLDFLEADPSENAKSAIGNALYSTLCNRCFPESVTDKQRLGRDLICTAYNLLLETSLRHTENRRKLRNATLLGGRRIGLALSLSREYLVVEALLDIFANLLPPIAVKDRRQDFVNSTFDATFFPGSSQLRNILLSPTGGVTDWEILSQDILNTLAAAHIAFPQPFEIRSAKIDDFVPNLVNRIYLDAEGFTSSIDNNGTYETFHVATQTVELIHIPPFLADSHVLISLKLNRFPDMGQAASVHRKNGSVDLTFELNTHQVKRFVDALNARRLGKHIVRAARKMSKLNVDLALDFNCNGVPYTEKATRVLSIDAASDQLMSPSSAKLCIRPDEDDDDLQVANSVDRVPKILKVPGTDVGKAATNPVRPPSSPVVVKSSPPRPLRVHFNEVAPPRTDVKGHKITSVKDTQLLAEYDENDGSPSPKQPVAKMTRSARNKRQKVDTSSEDVELPVTKRRKIEPSPIFSKPVQPNKRYRKKGRSSSPVPSGRVSLVADTKSRSTRASVKAVAAKREVTLKSKDVENKESDIHASTVKAPSKAKAVSDADYSSKSTVQVVKPVEEKNLRRSGRITRVSELKVTPKRSSADKVQELIAPTYENARQGPEDEENKTEASIKKLDDEKLPRQLLTHTAPPIGPPRALRSSPVVALDFNLVDTVMDDDFVSPATTPCPWDREASATLGEPETIDLTQDDASPHPVSRFQRSPVHPVKREKKNRLPLPFAQPSFAAPEISMLELPTPASKRIDRTLPTQDVLQDMVASRPQEAAMEPIHLLQRSKSPSVVEIETRPAPSKLQSSSMLRAEPLKPAKLFFEFRRPEETSQSDRAGPPHISDYPNPLQPRKYATPSKIMPPSRKPALNCTSNVKASVRPKISDSSRLMSFSPSTYLPSTGKPLGQSTLDSKSSRPPMEDNRKYAKSHKSKKREPSYDITYTTEPGEDYEDRDWDEADDYGIAQILNDIQIVLVQRISRKFDHVKADVRLGRASILREAADNMNAMRDESVAHFNLLIDFETEYASYRRKLIDNFEQTALVQTEIGQQVGETLRLHDRHMLSKVFPAVLPPLPSGLVNRKLA